MKFSYSFSLNICHGIIWMKVPEQLSSFRFTTKSDWRHIDILLKVSTFRMYTWTDNISLQYFEVIADIILSDLMTRRKSDFHKGCPYEAGNIERGCEEMYTHRDDLIFSYNFHFNFIHLNLYSSHSISHYRRVSEYSNTKILYLVYFEIDSITWGHQSSSHFKFHITAFVDVCEFVFKCSQH